MCVRFPKYKKKTQTYKRLEALPPSDHKISVPSKPKKNKNEITTLKYKKKTTKDLKY